jgi:hypothetical protein
MSAPPSSSTASSSTPSPSTAGSATLRANSIGTVGVTATVVSAAAPLTVMAGVAPIALAIGGVGVPSAYLLAGIVLYVKEALNRRHRGTRYVRPRGLFGLPPA